MPSSRRPRSAVDTRRTRPLGSAYRVATGAALALLAAACQGSGASAGAPRAAPGTEAHPRHVVNVFVGGIAESDDREGYTLGLDYERRLGPAIGVGAFAESVGELERVFAAGAQLYWHAFGDVVLIGGPGFERFDDEWRPIARVGIAYEIELENDVLLSPALFYDFAEESDYWIVGLNLGVAW